MDVYLSAVRAGIWRELTLGVKKKGKEFQPLDLVYSVGLLVLYLNRPLFTLAVKHVVTSE